MDVSFIRPGSLHFPDSDLPAAPKLPVTSSPMLRPTVGCSPPSAPPAALGCFLASASASRSVTPRAVLTPGAQLLPEGAAAHRARSPGMNSDRGAGHRVPAWPAAPRPPAAAPPGPPGPPGRGTAFVPPPDFGDPGTGCARTPGTPELAAPGPRGTPELAAPGPRGFPEVAPPGPRRTPELAPPGPRGSPEAAPPGPRETPEVAAPGPRRPPEAAGDAPADAAAATAPPSPRAAGEPRGRPMAAPGSTPPAPQGPEPPQGVGDPAYSLDDLDTVATVGECCARGARSLVTVGTGTFGRVHLVKQKTTERYFALKVMSISDVIRLKQEQHVHNEKAVLKDVTHPFLVKLFWTAHDARFLYMLLEFAPGGELFSFLRTRGRFSPATGMFYAAEITCALEFLHGRHVVYRDLKPENILLDRDGHVKLTDFGFAKKLADRTWTLCGTPEYLAPEVIQSKGHGRAVDWWALGILIFEMLSGFPPFFDDNPFGIYQKILACRIDFPRHLDFTSKDLIRKLLVVDRTRRLGCMKNGVDDVKRHRWFRGVDWDSVVLRKLKPPIVPKVSGDSDTSNFESYPEQDRNDVTPVADEDLETFKDF
ncbi:cAMP-dependent protein kinase catalytic subunit PRKX [Nannospalax galili]|nr:cAMP-dependent protein kinase catalytic subunit PRKX [Nannospalax galili]